MGYNAALLRFDQYFGTGTDDLEVVAFDVEEIRRWVYSPQMAIKIKWV